MCLLTSIWTDGFTSAHAGGKKTKFSAVWLTGPQDIVLTKTPAMHKMHMQMKKLQHVHIMLFKHTLHTTECAYVCCRPDKCNARNANARLATDGI